MHSVICTEMSHGDAPSSVFKPVLKSWGSMESQDSVSISHIEVIPHHKQCSLTVWTQLLRARSMTVRTFQQRNPRETISGIVTREPQDLAKLRKSGSCGIFGLLGHDPVCDPHCAPTQANGRQIGAVHQFDLSVGVSTNQQSHSPA